MDLKLKSAVIHGDLNAVCDYLESGCNPNQIATAFGHSSLIHHAFYNGNLDICEALLNAGAICPSAIERAIIQNSYNDLQLAIDEIKELVQRALFCLIVTKQYGMLKMLLRDYKCEINGRNACCTPLHMAIKTNIYPIVELLLEYGANPLIANVNGQNALDLAYKTSRENNRSEVAQRIYRLVYDKTRD